MSAIVLVVPRGLFVAKIIYQSSVQSLSVIANYVTLVSSSVIYFASQIFSQMNKCFFRSSDASPLNYDNLMVGSHLSILNTELLPPCGVYT
jgi:hypothetical protein